MGEYIIPSAVITMKKNRLSAIILFTLNLILFITASYLGIKQWGKYLPTNIQRWLNPYSCNNCNVILVSLDTLSANHLPCYGYNRNTAPHLCQFARENIFFKNMYANAHFTLPSHTTMFTGLLPSTHHVNETGVDQLNPTIPLLPEILQQNGYKTYFNIPLNSKNLSTKLVYTRGINQEITESVGSLDSWKQALSTLQNNSARGIKTFLFLHTYYVHSPYLIKGKQLYTNKTYPNIPSTNREYNTCSKEFLSAAKDILKVNIEKRAWYDETVHFKRLYDKLLVATDEAKLCLDPNNKDLFNELRSDYIYTQRNITTPDMAEYLSDLYDQKINELDEELRILLRYLSSDQLKNNTILIVTADHGEEFLEHNELLHATLYDSNIKVPLIMRIPGVGKKQVNTNAQTADITPTILDLVGIKGNYSFQGSSLVNIIRTGVNDNRYVAAERIYDNTETVRDKIYKLFLKKSNTGLIPVELYDTKYDPGETHNILFNHPDVVNNLKEKLQQILSRT